MENKANNLIVKFQKLEIKKFENCVFRVPFSIFHFLTVFCFLFFAACGSPKTDLRSFAPPDALIYLETNDLGETLAALTENKAFIEAAKSKPDFSRLKNVQLAVIVTGFETSEKQVTEENSILNFKPRFVAVADVHVWNWQTLRLTENNLNQFIRESYGDETKLETVEKNGGRLFVWTLKDSRRLFAFVENSRIFFGSGEAEIEKCLAASRGETESPAKSGRNFGAAENQIAAGFVSTAGIKEIADFAGVQAALQTTENDAGRSFIAAFLPTLLKNSVTEINWTATKTDDGIEDKISAATAPEVSEILRETLRADSRTSTDLIDFLPPDTDSSTVYNLENPLVAWRSLLLVAGKQTDAKNGLIVKNFAGTLLEAYGIADAETFLSAVDSHILTAQFDADGEKSIVAAEIKNVETLKKSISAINFKLPAENYFNAQIWKSEDGAAAAIIENKLILGDVESVLKCLQTKQNGAHASRNQPANRVVAVTRGTTPAEKIIEVLGEKKAENAQPSVGFSTETRFTEQGIERQTLSPFGLIGSMIAQIKE